MSANTNQLWVLVADEAVAHVYALPKPGAVLQPVHTLTDPDAHARDAEMRHDGHGQRAQVGVHASNATTSAGLEETHQHAQVFAGTVARWLAQERQAGRFSSLRVVAAPRFLGLLRKALPPQVADVVTDDDNHDLTHLRAEELTARLFPAADRGQ